MRRGNVAMWGNSLLNQHLDNKLPIPDPKNLGNFKRMNRGRRLLVFILLIGQLLLNLPTSAQTPVQCPENIGFEAGSFDHWDLSYGQILQTGDLDLSFSGQRAHLIIPRANAAMDPYGNFPMSCPNGSGFSIQLGDDKVGAQAERVSYTLTIPGGTDQYSIIYHYAVVLQNPNHAPYQQPKFQTEVFNVTDNKYVDCPSFQFVASPNLPGFLPSTVSPDIFYKPWAAVTLNLYGLGGKTIRLDFTTNDCSQGGHFGYAYLDIDEDCTSPIKGNVYCGHPTSITLRAPFGFQGYRWYNANLTQILGTSSTLTLSPPPPDGTVLALELIPYPGLGCQDTLYTKIDGVPDDLVFKVKDTVRGCINPGVDLMAPYITSGSSPGLRFSYFMDSISSIFISQPDKIKTSGLYFITASNPVGCTLTKPVYVKATDQPVLVFADSVSGCVPPGVDLTIPSLHTGSDPGLLFSYWLDQAGTNALPSPAAITTGGKYYVRGSNAPGCASTKAVQVKIARLDLHDLNACGYVNLKTAVRELGEPGFDYSYWTDPGLTTPMAKPDSIVSNGLYYVRGVHLSGCELIKPVNIIVKPAPDFAITNPPAVKYPETIDLASAISFGRYNYEFSFWKDALCTQKTFRPEAIVAGGTYYAKATTTGGCALAKPIFVTIIPPPLPSVTAPNAFSPNGDGINETFKIQVEGVVKLNNITIFNRYGQPVFWTKNINTAWDGYLNGRLLPVGTYYWTFDGVDSYRAQKVLASGSITLLK
jgi:gliding motility-associated-like protein